jgi:hypothetical protein
LQGAVGAEQRKRQFLAKHHCRGHTNSTHLQRQAMKSKNPEAEWPRSTAQHNSSSSDTAGSGALA